MTCCPVVSVSVFSCEPKICDPTAWLRRLKHDKVSVFSCEPKICDPAYLPEWESNSAVSVFSCEPKICDCWWTWRISYEDSFQCSRVNRRYVTIRRMPIPFIKRLVSVFSCEPKICDLLASGNEEQKQKFQCSRVNRRYVTWFWSAILQVTVSFSVLVWTEDMWPPVYIAALFGMVVSVFSCEPKICDLQP